MNAIDLMGAAIALCCELDDEHGDSDIKQDFLSDNLPKEIHQIALNGDWDGYDAAIEDFLLEEANAQAYAEHLLNAMSKWGDLPDEYQDQLDELLAEL